MAGNQPIANQIKNHQAKNAYAHIAINVGTQTMYAPMEYQLLSIKGLIIY